MTIPESLLLEGKSFQRWLLHCYVTTYGSIPNKTALESAIEVLEGRAQFGETTEREVSLRLASHQGNLYLDLGNLAHEVVEITAQGWRIITDPPVCFRRAQGTLPLPRPESDGSLQELRSFLHVGDEEWLLIQAWLLGAFHPRGPYAILVLSGEHGSAKSTTTRLLRSLIDPAKAPLRKEPRDDQTFAIMAHNNYVVALDNLSHLSARLSDNMCTLATGAGDAYRKLYYNDEETLFEDCRPQIFNGIEELATRGDLIDRCLHIKLLPFASEERQDEKAYWQRFEQTQPRILGALLDAVSMALRNLPQTTIKHLPRMADFALWVQAAESALTPTPGAFLKAYWNNRNEGTVEELDSSPVGTAILTLMQQVSAWTGTATDLKKQLEDIVGEKVTKAKTWPSNARALSNTLKRLAPSLRAQQIQVEMGRKERGRYVILTRITPQEEAMTQNSHEHDANAASMTQSKSVCVMPSSPMGSGSITGVTQMTQTLQSKKSTEPADSPPCTTRYEKHKQVAHEALAAHFVAGCWWCEKCEPQQLLMALGEETNYPQIRVLAHGFTVRPGRDEWLRFAQEAGYTLVGYALEAAQPRDVQEL